jgi:hypothetical protein
MTSTHTTYFAIQGLPLEAALTHIFPNLDSISLLSVGQLCEYGCTTTFTKHAVSTTSEGVAIITGTRSGATGGLWTMDPCKSNMPADTPEANTIIFSMSSALNHDTIVNRVDFYHASLFSPALSIWYGAIDAGQLTTWPGLTLAQARKCSSQPATVHKVHLDQQRSNQRSTRAPPPAGTKNQQPDVETRQQLEDTRQELEDALADACPSEPPMAGSYYIYVEWHATTGMVYMDPMGKLLQPSTPPCELPPEPLPPLNPKELRQRRHSIAQLCRHKIRRHDPLAQKRYVPACAAQRCLTFVCNGGPKPCRWRFISKFQALCLSVHSASRCSPLTGSQ